MAPHFSPGRDLSRPFKGGVLQNADLHTSCCFIETVLTGRHESRKHMKKTTRQKVCKFDFPASSFHVFMISGFPVKKIDVSTGQLHHDSRTFYSSKALSFTSKPANGFKIARKTARNPYGER
jgi:hypothetical protein